MFINIHCVFFVLKLVVFGHASLYDYFDHHRVLEKLLFPKKNAFPPYVLPRPTLFMQASTGSLAHGSAKTSPPAPLLQPSSYEALCPSHNSPRSRDVPLSTTTMARWWSLSHVHAWSFIEAVPHFK